jgi:transcriptional regulator with XRE-family HTH domain
MTAEEVKILREANNMTQAVFARRLGYSRIAINNWENKRCKPPANLLDQVAKAGLFTHKLNLTESYGIYLMCRDQLHLSHVQTLERMRANGHAPLTTDDQLMLVRKYPSILEGRNNV